MYLEILGKKVLMRTTETTIRELYNEMLKFKGENPEAEYLHIASQFSAVDFEIHLETIPHTQESLGFRIDKNQKGG